MENMESDNTKLVYRRWFTVDGTLDVYEKREVVSFWNLVINKSGGTLST